ncbi:DUF5655 domain-containing protein [Pedococcus bigeumensis]|uniref:DUF4287 domain-containing protein n=1 Tax=Pedococcus bigeumensis TaxID=433644 RepID=A0A502D4S0_9MICO|nr:DUF5655 domain-containing protein [Pedococcus bigeumensis]TPG19760.1 DUF4287 domain-containing protein [Pedococcus bigeumensis]
MEPADMMAAVTTSLDERTGRSLDEWVALVRETGPDPLDQRAVRAWLREVHGVPQNSQWAIADAAATAAGRQRPDVDAYTDALYSGAKAHLRPIHDAIIILAEGLGDDVRREGRGTYIPVVRRTQFVAVAPGPRDTVRVGFRFRETPPDDERLSPAKGFAQATHWLHLAADADEDDLRSLEPLLQAAYRQNG